MFKPVPKALALRATARPFSLWDDGPSVAIRARKFLCAGNPPNLTYHHHRVSYAISLVTRPAREGTGNTENLGCDWGLSYVILTPMIPISSDEFADCLRRSRRRAAQKRLTCCKIDLNPSKSEEGST